jgi:uncharacterized protein (TIGR03067 family)
MKTLIIAACSLSLFIVGCSKPGQSDAVTLQGTWSGQESGASGTGSPSLLLHGTNLEFHGANPLEWYKATFTLHEDTTPKQLVAIITDCPVPRYIGKPANAIYQIQDGALTITGNEPGNPAMPTSFDAPHARTFVFKKP